MLKRLLLPAAAGAAIFGAAALVPAPASAHWASTPASVTHQNAQGVSDVIQVQRRHRERGHRHHPQRWHRPYHVRPHFYAPYAFAPRCGYVWSPRAYRHVWRCW